MISYLDVDVAGQEAHIHGIYLAPLLSRNHNLEPQTSPTSTEERRERCRRGLQVFP